MNAAVAALCLSILAAPGTGTFPRFTPLSTDALYAKRLRFKDGEPRISVGLMSGQSSVTVGGARGPVRLMFDEDAVPKTIYGDVGARFTLKVSQGRPGQSRFWVIVHASSVANRVALDDIVARHKKKGHRVKIFEVGLVMGLKGNVLDTRQRRVGLGGSPGRAAARALLTRLQARGEGEDLFIHEEVVTRSSGLITVHDGRGRALHRTTGPVAITAVEGGAVAVGRVEYNRGYRSHGFEDRSYHGEIYVVVGPRGGLAVVNSVGSETMLTGLVPAEMFASAPLEALKAQAVTARGEVFSKLARRHLADPFHLCSAQHCQVYAGTKLRHPNSDRAVALTRGRVAVRPRIRRSDPLEIVDARYSSSCGGHSEHNEVVWGTPPAPSLRGRLDASGHDPALRPFTRGLDDHNVRAFVESYLPTACARSKFTRRDRYRWRRTVTSTHTQQMLSHLDVGQVIDVSVLGRGAGGRVTGVRVRGVRGVKDVLRELPVRRLFGNLYSGLFVLDVVRRADGAIDRLEFVGAGWGHGVGMCQTGAMGRAENGQTYEAILSHYYNGAVLERIY